MPRDLSKLKALAQAAKAARVDYEAALAKSKAEPANGDAVAARHATANAREDTEEALADAAEDWLAVIAELEAARAALREVEWSGVHPEAEPDAGGACPSCSGTKGHASDCALARALGR